MLLYLINPLEAYNFNQEVEEHSFATYDQYVKENVEMLKTKPAPRAAINYGCIVNALYKAQFPVVVPCRFCKGEGYAHV